MLKGHIDHRSTFNHRHKVQENWQGLKWQVCQRVIVPGTWNNNQERFFTRSFGIKASSTCVSSYQHGPPQTTACSYTGRQCLPLFWLLFTQLLPNYGKGLHVWFLQRMHWPDSTRGQLEQRHVSTVALRVKTQQHFSCWVLTFRATIYSN